MLYEFTLYDRILLILKKIGGTETMTLKIRLR